jgi:predicted nucleic acid-binding protein
MAPTDARSTAPERAGQRPRRQPATLIAYIDTSALIKLLVHEDGSDLADELWSRASSRLASRLVYPEARAALAAAQRSRRIDVSSHGTAVKDLDGACAAMTLVGIDWELAIDAGDLAERYSLRGYDAVHLATALSIDDAELALVTWDRDLARAAGAAGLAVVPRRG